MLKKVYSLIMIIMLVASCASKKQVTSSTIKTDVIIDSATQNKDIAEDLQIEWFFDGEEASGITDTSSIPKWLKPVLPSYDKPPKKGKLRISVSRHFSSSTQQTKIQKSVKSKQKEKTKTTEKAKGNVKSKKWKWLVVLIIVIIIGFIVKYLLEQKNNIKKAWRKVKESLSLQHPNEHRGNAEERPSERH